MQKHITVRQRNRVMTKKIKPALTPERRIHLHRSFLFALALVFALALESSARPDVFPDKDKNPTGESHFTRLDGARIHYVNYGKGDEALVLIHGWTCNLDNWRDQFADFAQ